MFCSVTLIYFDSFNFAYNKSKLYETLGYGSRDILNFLGKGLAIVSPLHFVYDFSRKMFLMLYSINWPNFIIWLLLLLETLANMCIIIACDVLTSQFFEISLMFLTKPFCYITRISRQKSKYLHNQEEFLRWNKKRF